MRENGYERMPPIEETLASYLSMGEDTLSEGSLLAIRALQASSRLNGRAYAAAGQGSRLVAHHGGASGVPGRPAEGPG